MGARAWDRIQNLHDPISRASYLCVAAAGIPTLLILFQPTPLEIVYWLIGEFIGTALFAWWDRPLFLAFAPAARSFFPAVDHAFAGRASLAERLEMLRAMTRFPRDRMVYSWLISVPKLAAPWIAIVCFWHYTHPWTVQLSRVLLWSTFNCCFFNAVLFFECHEYISDVIQDLHRRHDWTEVFRESRPAVDERGFAWVEGALLVGSLANIFLAQFVFVSTRGGGALTAGLIVVAAGGMISLARIWYVSRRLHATALESVRRSLDGSGPRSAHGVLSLHSDPTVAHVEQTVNALTERLKAHERELLHWISTRTEEERMLALAEISALVVHDLSSPLQAARLAADQANAERDRLAHPESLDRIVLNTSRALDLVNSLRAYLRASAPPESGAPVVEVHQYVMRILSTRFPPDKWAALRLTLDPRLDDLLLELTKADLIHVLMNLYANSFENMFDHRTPDPSLEVALESSDGDTVTLRIQDSGSGLDPDRFEELTGFALLVPHSGPGPQSLGLRLVRRLVERQGGSLDVGAPSPGQRGTRFRLKLRRAGAAVSGSKAVG